MHFANRTFIAAAVLGLAGVFSVHGAVAQDSQPPTSMEAPPTAFDDNKLQSFVFAYLQVDEISRTYLPQMQDAESIEQQQQIQQQATQEMVTAVENAEGISVEEYNAIAEAAQADPELAMQLDEMIQQAAGQ
jgi:hypothetical protein